MDKKLKTGTNMNKKNNDKQEEKEMSKAPKTNDQTEVTVKDEVVVVDDEKKSDEVESEKVDEVNDNHHWYILQCYSSQEYKVQVKLNDLIERELLQEKISTVLIPEEETIEIKNNNRVEKIRKIFPGYVFIKMEDDEHIFFKVKKIVGVSKFIGDRRPAEVKEDEILKILRKIGEKTKKIDVDFEIDEMIKVIDGPFRGYSGNISEINAERGKLKSMISIFGRDTPVELDFDQVEKVV